MPLIETKGAASAQGFGEFAQQTAATYIEDVFSTWLYTGNGSTQTITNGIDLSGKGGLVWIKGRSYAGTHELTDTVRGATQALSTNSSAAQGTKTAGLTAFTSSGFSVGSNSDYNSNTNTIASWTFREQPKFFDVVTWTGNAATPRTITHNLGSVPGCIIVKKYIGTAEDWFVFHRSMGNTGTFQYFCILNSTAAQDTGGYGMEKASSWTSTTFSLVSAGGSSLNESGATYVAYLFAHNAGGFGLSGTDNVISCGSYTGVGSTQQDITLGYEPQWLLIKRVDVANSWSINDNMRGLYQNADNALCPNNANAEAATFSMSGALQPTATGFHLYNGNSAVNASGGTYIYIAIRRGPMKVPTSGTSVFSTTTNQPASSGLWGATNLVDFALAKWTSGSQYWSAYDRLRGYSPYLQTNSTSAEISYGDSQAFARNADWYTAGLFGANIYSGYFISRAPGFFDVVCYTGDGTDNRQVIHNLGVTPELVIVKPRSVAWQWWVYHTGLGNTRQGIVLNSTAAKSSNVDAFSTNGSPFSSSYFLQSASSAPYPPNASSYTYVAYLFATCAGVSKVGSYTGTGALQTINCGFTGGARFVLIKRTDSTGDWYVYDSARGISSGNDPYLLLNSTAAEVTGTNYVDTTSVGFQVTAAAPAGLNANGGTYIFLAIA